MGLFRANDRHPVDERVLVIQNMEDFRLWRERNKLKINGLIYPYRISKLSLDRAKASVVEAFRRKPSSRFFVTSYAQATYERHMPDNIRFTEDLRKDGLNNPAVRILKNLTDAFMVRAGNQEWKTRARPSLRLNSTHPQFFHAHAPTMTFAFSGGGTVCKNTPEDVDGDVYKVPTGYAGLLGEDIAHRARRPKPSWEENPRVTLII